MRVLFYSFLIFFLSSCHEATQETLLEVKIEGMSCRHSCAPIITKKLLSVTGVLKVVISFEKKTAQISYNPESTTKENIIDKIESIAGGIYKASISKEIKQTFSPTKTSNMNKVNSVEFDLSKPDVSHSSEFQLPNLFSLLNSILK